MPSLCFPCPTQIPRTHGNHQDCLSSAWDMLQKCCSPAPHSPALPCNGSMSVLKLSPSLRRIPSSAWGWGPPASLILSNLLWCWALSSYPWGNIGPQDALRVPSVLCHVNKNADWEIDAPKLLWLEIQSCGRLHRKPLQPYRQINSYTPSLHAFLILFIMWLFLSTTGIMNSS